MADNYIEKQMEQYQARKAAWEQRRKYGKKKSKLYSARLKANTLAKEEENEEEGEEMN